MKDWSKVAVLVSLLLLVVLVSSLDFGSVFGEVLRTVRHLSPWVFLGLFFWFFCGRGTCCTGKACNAKADA